MDKTYTFLKQKYLPMSVIPFAAPVPGPVIAPETADPKIPIEHVKINYDTVLHERNLMLLF